VLVGDHGFVKVNLGDLERGELTADQGLVNAICGEGDDSSYLSPRLVSVEYSLAESVIFNGFGMIFLNWGRRFGVRGACGLETPDDAPGVR
jgi:hypothetical protein